MSKEIESGFDDPSTPVTELPDGSGCFTATVMSQEEAMALPRGKRPLCYRIPGSTYVAIFEAVGAASMCWNPRPGDAVFDSTQAEAVAVTLCFTIADDMDKLHERIERLRKALIGLVGVETKEELEKMEAAMRTMPGNEADKVVGINAVQALLLTMEE